MVKIRENRHWCRSRESDVAGSDEAIADSTPIAVSDGRPSPTRVIHVSGFETPVLSRYYRKTLTEVGPSHRPEATHERARAEA